MPNLFDEIIGILLSIVNEPEGKSFQGFRPGGRFKRRPDGLIGRIQNRISHDVFLPSGARDSNGTPVTAQVPPAHDGPTGSVTALDM